MGSIDAPDDRKLGPTPFLDLTPRLVPVCQKSRSIVQ